MSRVARELQADHGDVDAMLKAITHAAETTIPHAVDCGITYMIGRSKLESRAPTGDLPRSVDALQEEVGEGPCLDAVWEQYVVRVDDVAAEQRWPRFAERAADLGVGSMMCFQLFVQGDHMGAMNVYARTPGAFDDDQEIGLMLASHAAIALSGAEHEEHLRAGMSNRDVIGQAKGILMERFKFTADQAFGVLVRTSSLTNRKLSDIAEELTATGQLPDRTRSPVAPG
jgi:putative methionine-R-sulfoxide reductase with GAF domain